MRSRVAHEVPLPGWLIFLALLALSCGGAASAPSPAPTPGPVGRFLYATGGGDRVAGFRIDNATGRLEPLGETRLTDGARGLSAIADPSGRFLFVARSGGRGGVDVYAIDSSSGALRASVGSPFDLDRQTDSLTVSPSGRFLWSTRTFNLAIDSFPVNAQTGGLGASSSLSLSVPPTSPALRPDGRFLYFARGDLGEIRMASVDTGAGRLTEGPAIAAPDLVRSMTIDPAGAHLYVTTATAFSSDTLFLYRVDLSSGALARVPGSPFAAGFDAAASNLRPDRVTLDPTGRFAYVQDRPGRTGARSRGVFVFPVQASGLFGPSFLGPFSTPAADPFLIGDNAAFALDPSGRFAYLTDGTTNTISAFTVDATTGGLTAVGTPVPVPAGTGMIVVTP